MNGTGNQPAGADLLTRFAVGLILAAAACLLVWLGGWALRALVLLGAVLMLAEWGDIHRVPRFWSWVGGILLAILLLGVAEWLYPVDQIDLEIASGTFAPALTGFAAAGGLGFLLGLLSRRAAMFGGFLYVGIPAFSLLVLGWVWPVLVFWVLIVTWATDIFAYFAGRAIGGPKLAPRISPNKTWAGLLGGILGATIAGAIVAQLFQMGALFLIAGPAMAIAAQLGDLYESSVKRRAGVKDSGTILPGHGGVLDRVDGLLPVAVLVLIMLMAGLWTA